MISVISTGVHGIISFVIKWPQYTYTEASSSSTVRATIATTTGTFRRSIKNRNTPWLNTSENVKGTVEIHHRSISPHSFLNTKSNEAFFMCVSVTL